jgi:hypothetical protein
MNDLGRLWEETVVVSFKIQFLHFLTETEEKYRNFSQLIRTFARGSTGKIFRKKQVRYD